MARRRKLNRVEEASHMEMEADPPDKVFKKKCLNIETLDSYEEEKLKENTAWWKAFAGKFKWKKEVKKKKVEGKVRKEKMSKR